MFGATKLPSMVVRAVLMAGLVASLAGACGSGEDRPGQVTSENSSGSGSASGSGSGSASASASGTGGETTQGSDGYTPGSDVTAHAAIGDDVAAIKEQLAAAKDGRAVDWAAVEAVWEKGGASKKSDGSTRTLRALVDAPEVVSLVDAAITGGPSDAVRAQRVEKGLTVLLARKVIDELDAAAEKVADGKIAAADGAPHNVDEGWAFFTAEGHGPAATADKRAADFKLDGKVREPIVEALVEAQKAAGAGDASGLRAASARVRAGIEYVFYLATHKYLAAGDEVGRAEGAAFYLGIQTTVKGADPTADAAIVGAFDSGDEAAGRAALHRPAVLSALGVEASERVDS